MIIGLVSLLMYDAKKVQVATATDRRPMNSVSSFRYIYRLSQMTYLYALVMISLGRLELTYSPFHNLATMYPAACI